MFPETCRFFMMQYRVAPDSSDDHAVITRGSFIYLEL